MVTPSEKDILAQLGALLMQINRLQEENTMLREAVLNNLAKEGQDKKEEPEKKSK